MTTAPYRTPGSPPRRARLAPLTLLALALAPLLLIPGCTSDAGLPVGEGTVEVHEANVSAPVSATVLEIRADEGDRVQAGDTLALLLLNDLEATIAMRLAELASAKATLRDLEAGARVPELARAEAELAAAEAEVVRATRELERLRALTAAGALSPQDLDNAVARQETATGRRDAAAEALRLLGAGTRPERVAAARARVKAAEATLATALARQTDLVLRAPFDGRVLSRLTEPGEVLGAGSPALTVGEVGRPWVRAWFTATVISRLSVGDSALVELPAGTVRARVSAIAPRAEFTPRVALTEEERADLLFGVKVEPVDPGEAEALHPGLWARVRLFVAPAGTASSPVASEPAGAREPAP